MAKNHNNEPEEVSTDDVFIDAEYNPLNDPINEKPYTKPNVTINPEELKGDIPEPDFTPPPMGDAVDPFEEEIKAATKKQSNTQTRQSQPKQEQRPRPEPYNPALEGAPKREFSKSAKVAAEMIMSGYELLHKIGNNAIKISEKKIQKLVKEDKISLSMKVDYDEHGNQMTVREFISEYNDQQDGVLKVDPEWKEETMPILITVLEKRGIGATPEQQLIFQVGKDLGSKTMIVASALSVQKSMINMWEKQYELNKQSYMGGGYANAKPEPAPQETKPNESYVGTIVRDGDGEFSPFENDIDDEFDPFQEDVNSQSEFDPLNVNHQVEQMTNPQGVQSSGTKKRGRPKKK